MSISDDDAPHLSADTFAALQEFYKEQEERENRLKLISSEATDENIPIDEDWQLSQFWYDDKTIDILVDVALKAVGPSGKIALVSCPTLYKKMRQKANDCEITLFEYDERFSIYGKDFMLYDYKSPLLVPRDKSSYYDIVLADPPFLSEECAIMADLVQRLLDLKKSSFEPTHRNNLANEFWCYSNFNMDELL
ncbi:hypothetical protein NQ314_010736 [Rhamnusium bicolor]|uniref:Protein-lysine N-methyltransferase n=1 Tax=Rhamnusium bicolor TaxID=1586634 RepID=A0AAV8XPI7_9CUCU|nr:hypothetical protein NQ314_010736 [Rhamnusium bicolor]